MYGVQGEEVAVMLVDILRGQIGSGSATNDVSACKAMPKSMANARSASRSWYRLLAKGVEQATLHSAVPQLRQKKAVLDLGNYG